MRRRLHIGLELSVFVQAPADALRLEQDVWSRLHLPVSAELSVHGSRPIPPTDGAKAQSPAEISNRIRDRPSEVRTADNTDDRPMTERRVDQSLARQQLSRDGAAGYDARLTASTRHGERCRRRRRKSRCRAHREDLGANCVGGFVIRCNYDGRSLESAGGNELDPGVF